MRDNIHADLKSSQDRSQQAVGRLRGNTQTASANRV